MDLEWYDWADYRPNVGYAWGLDLEWQDRDSLHNARRYVGTMELGGDYCYSFAASLERAGNVELAWNDRYYEYAAGSHRRCGGSSN